MGYLRFLWLLGPLCQRCLLHRRGWFILPVNICYDIYKYTKYTLIGSKITKFKTQKELLEAEHAINSDEVDEYGILKMTKSESKNNPSKSDPSIKV